MNSDQETQVRERAYSIWQAEGQPTGRDAEHWHRAVHEIDQEEQARASLRSGRRGSAAAAPILRSRPVKRQADAKKGGAAPASDKAAGTSGRDRRRAPVGAPS